MRARLPVLLAASVVALVLQLGPAAAFSGANGKVAFVRSGSIAIANADASGVTTFALSGANPAWSPSGSQIAYDNGGAIRTVNADGAGDAAVGGGAGTRPAWSPDGTQIAFQNGTGGISRVPSGGGAATLVIATGTEPAWSPDGTKIAYRNGDDIWVVTISSSATSNLTNTGTVTDLNPTWSPDGSKIGFVSDAFGSMEILEMNADGTSPRRVASNALVESDLAWSPDGTKILFGSGGNLYYVEPALANPPTVPFISAGTDSQPDWGTAFSNTALPAITPAGAKLDGDSITVSNGTWSVPISSFAYQWKRCDSAGGNCINITGATSQSYTIQSADVSFKLRATVTASNASGSQSATSAATDTVAGRTPANTVPPTVTGTPTVGISLSSTTGTWTGTQTIVFAYQWQSCTSSTDTATCSSITGATGSTYAPVVGDAGKFLRVRVTGTNSLGSAEGFSALTAAVASNVPANTVLPLISGTAQDGFSLTTTTGTWTGAATITFKFQWRRCDTNGANCSSIAAATLSSYVLKDEDVGKRIRVDVTGTNSVGSTTVTAEATAVVTGLVPTSSTRPSISGTAQAGQILNALAGTWTGTEPFVFTYQWRRCNATGGSCVNIGAATARSYILTADDIGSTIIVFVTATGPAGVTTASSSQTAVVTAGNVAGATRPARTRLPAISGAAARGQTLRASQGVWSGTTPMTFSFQWQRCARARPTCTAIPRATLATYVLAAADVGSRMRVVVSAANAAGSTPATSAFTDVVTARLTGKRITGTAKADRLTGTPGQDTISAGAGNDRVDAFDGVRDTVDCGPGRDTAIVDQLDVVRNCERVIKRLYLRGTARADRLVGGKGADTLLGLGGADRLSGGAGNDTIDGGAGRDTILGGAGNDSIEAADGERDTIDCGPGRDTAVVDQLDVVRNCERVTKRTVIRGTKGADRLFGTTAPGIIFGGPGDDIIVAAYGSRDVVDCGPGDDIAVVDEFDVVKGCERVVVR